MRFPYTEKASKEELFKKIKTYLESRKDGFPVEVDISDYENESINVSANGVNLDFRFESNELIVDSSFGFLATPFKKQILSQIEKKITKMIS